MKRFFNKKIKSPYQQDLSRIVKEEFLSLKLDFIEAMVDDLKRDIEAEGCEKED